MMKRYATCYKSGLSLRRVVSTHVVRRDRLSAFNTLVLENQSMVYNLVYRILGEPDLASTAARDTFLRAARRGLPKRHRKAPSLWLMQTAIIVCQEQLCQMPIRRPDLCEPPAGNSAQEIVTAHATCQPSCDAAQALLNGLPLDQRVALVLSDVQGLSNREIADVTGLPAGVIRSRLSQGRAALRNALLVQGVLSPGAPPRLV